MLDRLLNGIPAHLVMESNVVAMLANVRRKDDATSGLAHPHRIVLHEDVVTGHRLKRPASLAREDVQG